jgi:NAD(P)-dependent dehydrogenase (short-subunit alcohol dehydrogenase family)
VITGGSTGMGLATAKRFVQEGADHVLITGRRKDVLYGAVEEIGEKATGIPGDVASLNDLDHLYESVKGYGRQIDVAFANAGVAQVAQFGTIDEKFYDLHFDANVKSIFFTVQKALPLLNDSDFRSLATGRRADKDERRARKQRSTRAPGRSGRNRQSCGISRVGRSELHLWD